MAPNAAAGELSPILFVAVVEAVSSVTMSEAPAKRAKLAVEKANGSSPGGTGAVSSPRRAARAVVDTDAELLEADTAANGDAPAITDAMEAENAKCDTPSHHRTH